MNSLFRLLSIIPLTLLVFTVHAQCPVIECGEDITLYLPADNCSVAYHFDAPIVTDQCYGSANFHYTGETQIYVVPAGVTEVKVNAWGASGGHGSGPQNHLNMGGKGALASGVIAVNEGDTLYINIGGKGQNAQLAGSAGGGWNGGGHGGFDAAYTGNGAGGGGGATDIRIGGNSLDHRVLVAAGGGGAAKNAIGGDGGEEYGMAGNAFGVGQPGMGGEPHAGGAVYNTDREATPGEFGLGGSGSTNHASWGGGGGGAGYYGGGGGTAVADHSSGHAGSGGGGSSFAGDAADVLLLAGQRIGNGMLVLTYSNTDELRAEQIEGPASGDALTTGITTYTFAAPGLLDTTYCSIQVTVLDTVAPVVLTENLTVYLSIGDQITISPDQIDNGSFDNCTIESMSLSQDTFYGHNSGDFTVELTVTDASGNTASAQAVVTVIRKQPEMMQRPNLETVNNYDGDLQEEYQSRNLSSEKNGLKTEMLIYPNPTTTGSAEIVIFVNGKWEQATLNIWSANGQKVYSEIIPSLFATNYIKTSVQDLSSGVYLVQVSTETEMATQRLIVK